MINRKLTVNELMGGDDDWEKIVTTDNFLSVFDRLPDQMRIIVDLKMTGMDNDNIANALRISPHTVKEHLRRAKRRFVNNFFDAE